MPDFENMIPRYDTREQIEAVRFQEPKPSMFRDSFFKGADVYSPTETIEWDEVREGAGMARYVDEDLEVEATEREGFSTREITSPRVQEKRVLGVRELRKRLPGENIYSAQTPAQRAQYYLDGDHAFCMDAIDRRVEQQCAQMMVNGRVDIIGKGVNTYVDYELPLKLTLSGTSRWGQTGVKAFDVLRMMSKTLRKRSHKPTGLLMDMSVADVLMKDEEYKAMLDNLRMEMGQIAPGPIVDLFQAAQFFGKIKYPGIGELDLFTYDGTYKNDQNREVPYLDEGRILMLSDEATQNRMLYGAVTVMDESGKFVTVEGRYVPEYYTDRRTKTQTVMVTSRPLPAPYQSDSWWSAKVL